MPDVAGSPAAPEAGPSLAVVPAPEAAPVTASADELTRRLARVRRQKADLERELADAAETITHARDLAKARAVKAALTDADADRAAAQEAQDLLRQAIEKETALRHQVEPLQGAEAQLGAELALSEKVAHGARRRRVLERLEAGAPAVRAQLLEALILGALEIQLRAGVPPASAERICAALLGEQLMRIAPEAEKRFWEMAKEVEHVA